MSRARRPEDAFEIYIGLGAERSYQAVADRLGVSKRTISARAKAEHWQERWEAILREARGGKERTPIDAEAPGARHATHLNALQEAVRDVVTPVRLKAILATLVKSAIQKEDVGAAKFLVERVMGKVRNETLPATVIDIPNGLETTSDVRRAANAILQAITDGGMSPEDGQRTATVIESARKAIETDELEKRLTAIEENIKKDQQT